MSGIKSTSVENPSSRLFAETNQLSLDACDEIFEEIRGSIDPARLAGLFDRLLAQQPVLGYAFGRGSFFWRGRKCEKDTGWDNVKDTVYPRRDIASIQRLNDRGDPIFYGATRLLTVLNELGVREGDYVHLVALRLNQGVGVHFIAIGEFFHVFKAGFSRLIVGEPCRALSRVLNDFGPQNGQSIIYVDAFLSDLLADSKAYQNDYAHTRALHHAVFRKLGQAEGFFYPSVKDRIGMNLAIKVEAFDAKIQVVSSQVVQITRIRPFGFFDFKRCRHAKTIASDGSFVWLPPAEQHQWIVFGMTTDEESFLKAHGDTLRGNEFFDFLDVARR